MRSKVIIAVVLGIAALAARAEGEAKADEAKKDEARKDEAKADEVKKEPATKDDVKALAEELRRLKLEIGLRDVEYRSYAGMGPAASKVYFAPKGLSIGGYGEFVYDHQVDHGAQSASDTLRAVVYAGYRFNDWIVFNSELEFEHAGKEVSVEFAYLDFHLRDWAQVRVGNLLVPVGFLNELHEPAFFNGVFRPDIEQNLIPTTWDENGIGLHGEASGLRYKAYLLTGLDLFRDTGDEPIEPGSWIRESRSGGAESRAATVAGVLSLEYGAGPVTVAGSIYRGRADQRQVPGLKADVTLAEAHAGLAWRGLTARVLGVVGTLSHAGQVSEALAFPTGETLGSRVQGGYGEVGYDVLGLLAPGGEAALTPFVRWERYDLNARVPAGFARDPALDLDVVTTGLTYKPIPTVVVKGDWQWREDRSHASRSQLNVGAGYVF